MLPFRKPQSRAGGAAEPPRLQRCALSTLASARRTPKQTRTVTVLGGPTGRRPSFPQCTRGKELFKQRHSVLDQTWVRIPFPVENIAPGITLVGRNRIKNGDIEKHVCVPCSQVSRCACWPVCTRTHTHTFNFQCWREGPCRAPTDWSSSTSTGAHPTGKALSTPWTKRNTLPR